MQTQNQIKKAVIFLILYLPLVAVGQFDDSVTLETKIEKKSYTFLFVHGAWGGGREYAKVDSLLSLKGHIVYRPTLTGLGKRSHLANEQVNLTAHINDILNLIAFEDLRNIVLVGHSYGGMVISGVAQVVPERIDRMIYFDAFVPKNGESIRSINGEETWNGLIVPKIKDGFVLYPFSETRSTPPTDVPQPLGTFTATLSLKNPATKQIATYFILMKENGRAMFEEWGARRAIENGWEVFEMEGGHYAMRDQPDKLVEKLEVILEN